MRDGLVAETTSSGIGPRGGRTAVTGLAAAVTGLTLAAWLTACGGDYEFEPPDREGQVEEADSSFSQAMFDTVEWESEEVRLLEGNVVFSSKCRQCHGPLGRGGTEYASERGLAVPSLVTPDWEYAGDLEAVRRRIFVGHPSGMPTWGVAGISPREIDAVAFYIVERLRPDVLGGG
jgi:mono/diheme cytochrome c family protein